MTILISKTWFRAVLRAVPDRPTLTLNEWAALLMLPFSLLLPLEANADKPDRTVVPKLYKNECSACHLAYPAQYLGVGGWRRITAGLDKHFGTDASVSLDELEVITRYLVEPGVSRKRGVDTAVAGRSPLRITGTEWFVRKHREVPDGAWRRASIRSAANCAACHGGAEQGDFNEHAVRIPPK